MLCEHLKQIVLYLCHNKGNYLFVLLFTQLIILSVSLIIFNASLHYVTSVMGNQFWLRIMACMSVFRNVCAT